MNYRETEDFAVSCSILMKNYTVAAHTESFDTDDLEEAKSVAISMSQAFGYATIIDNKSNEIIERY